MGHIISGIKNHGTEHKVEVAYLNRSAFNPVCFAIYSALEAHDCNAFSCGNGTGRNFSKEKLLNALIYLGTEEMLEAERAFINDCLTNLDENEEIYIEFF